MKFELTDEDVEKVKKWIAEQNKKAIEIQKKKIKKGDDYYKTYKTFWKMGYPYSGCIGGEYTYKFTPTSIGTFIYVANDITGDELHVTEDVSW